MSQPEGATGPAIATAIIPRLTAAAAQFAARHEEPNPVTILAVATTRAEALEVVFKGTRMPGTETYRVYAVVMTGRFTSYRSGPSGTGEQLPNVGSALVVVLDAKTFGPLDTRLGDQDDPALLSRIGPVTLLKGKQPS